MASENDRKFLHDLANPLSIVNGNVKIALRKIERLSTQQPELKEIVEKLLKASHACETMMSQLSDKRQHLIEALEEPQR